MIICYHNAIEWTPNSFFSIYRILRPHERACYLPIKLTLLKPVIFTMMRYSIVAVHMASTVMSTVVQYNYVILFSLPISCRWAVYIYISIVDCIVYYAIAIPVTMKVVWFLQVYPIIWFYSLVDIIHTNATTWLLSFILSALEPCKQIPYPRLLSFRNLLENTCISLQNIVSNMQEGYLTFCKFHKSITPPPPPTHIFLI